MNKGSTFRSCGGTLYADIFTSWCFAVGSKKSSTSERPGLKVIESSSETEVDGGPLSHSSSSSLGGTRSKWETVVVVAVNLSRLDMSTNMGSVMGQTL